MKFSKSWLLELLNLEIDTNKLADQLTMVGLEVANITPVAKDFSGVVVGEILEVNKHPDADKLSVCTVNIGDIANPLVIVCGASNVRKGLMVPVAVIGAELPNNLKIKKAKLRGVESNGMMCSAVELGICEKSSGLLELPYDAPIGTDVRKYLVLDDSIIEIELTANRGDCLSLLGIAREVAAINRIKLQHKKIPEFIGNSASLPINITAGAACPHYCGRIIRGVNNKISTPIWMRERMRRSGINTINAVVDVMNYVMLELGQPMHAFDLAKIGKKIDVRYSHQGEQIKLLDGKELTLDDKTLVIANDKVLAIAGVMGGAESGVTTQTTDIFLESAYFTQKKLAGVARKFGLQTDASYRYERGVDYNLQMKALNRATELLIEIVGGAPSEISHATCSENIPEPKVIKFDTRNIEKILGVAVENDEVHSILSCLEMTVKKDACGFIVSAPSFRFDISIEEDLIEEIARIYGYQHIKEQKIFAEFIAPSSATHKDIKHRMRELLVDLGYNEIVTYSFTDPKLQSLFDPDNAPLQLTNPISPELSVMRTSLWPGLMNAAKYNLNRQKKRIRLFEIGLRFLQKNNQLEQLPTLSGIALGNVLPEQWSAKQKEQVDFFDLKNDVAAILKLCGHVDNVEYKPAIHAGLHPNRAAQIFIAGNSIGFIGELHPKISQSYEIDKNACLFEIDLSSIISDIGNVFKEFSKFPKMQRDIAIVVDKNIAWQQIKQEILDTGKELLYNVELFDIYQGGGVGADKKSVAIHLGFQKIACTLTDTEVESQLSQIILSLKEKFGASLRG